MNKWKSRLPQLKLPHFNRRQWLLAGSIPAGLLCGFFMWATFAPQTIAYNYGRDASCITSPRLFPGLSKTTSGEAFRLHRPASISIGKIALYANTVCASHQAAPEAEKAYQYRERLFGIAFLSRQITVKTPNYPMLATRTIEKQTLAPDAPLTVELNTADTTFTYRAIFGSYSSTCHTNQQEITCDLTPLALTYAQQYTITIVRTYANKPFSTLATVPIQTITPTSILATSIPNGGVAQDKPTQVTLTTDKPIKELGIVRLVTTIDGHETVVPTTSSFTDNQIIVNIGQELARKVSFELRIASIKATDSSGLATKSYSLPFSTSGGPKVKTASIGSRNVALNPIITLTFDQALQPSQPVSKSVTLAVNGAAMAAVLTVSGNKLSIKPTSPLPLCTLFTITLDHTVQNQFGISGDSAWSIKSRTICYTTFSIGASVRGRPVIAYRFGTGSEMIIYLGAMHGSEANSKSIMNEWFSEMDAHPERIPAHRSIVIIPTVNPDGIAAGTRFNARGVDLNRNFPANDWKSVVTTPDNSQPTAAGGPSPLSEPESQALATYINQTAPRLVMSFHSKAAVVEANEGGDSVSIASGYALRAGYRAVPKSQSAPIFQYDTTGALEDWMRDKLGRAAIVVELASSTNSEFARNKDALWYTVGL